MRPISILISEGAVCVKKGPFVTVLVMLLSSFAFCEKELNSVQVPFDRIFGAPIVSVTIQGKQHLMLMSSSTAVSFLFAANSSISNSPHQLEVQIASMKLSAELRNYFNPKLQSNLASGVGSKICPVDGVLGVDFLNKLCVGFDFWSGTLTIWKGGDSAWSEGEKWVTSSSPWPGLSENASARFIRLTKLPNRMSYFSFTGGEKISANVLLDTVEAIPQLFLEKRPKESTTVEKREVIGDRKVESPVVISSAFMRNELGCQWGRFQESNPDENPNIPKAFDGGIGPISFNSRRVLCDFAGGKLCLEPVDQDMALSLFLSNVLDCPLRISGDSIYFGPVPTQPYFLKMKPCDGWRVIRVGNVPVEDVLTALRKGDKIGRLLIAKLIREREEKSLTIVVESETDVVKIIFDRPLGLS